MQSSIVLSSDDIEEIDRFHTAWCEENGVKKTDARALEVASGLIDWYSKDQRYRLGVNLLDQPDLPSSHEIAQLLKQIA